MLLYAFIVYPRKCIAERLDDGFVILQVSGAVIGDYTTIPLPQAAQIVLGSTPHTVRYWIS